MIKTNKFYDKNDYFFLICIMSKICDTINGPLSIIYLYIPLDLIYANNYNCVSKTCYKLISITMKYREDIYDEVLHKYPISFYEDIKRSKVNFNFKNIVYINNSRNTKLILKLIKTKKIFRCKLTYNNLIISAVINYQYNFIKELISVWSRFVIRNFSDIQIILNAIFNRTHLKILDLLYSKIFNTFNQYVHLRIYHYIYNFCLDQGNLRLFKYINSKNSCYLNSFHISYYYIKKLIIKYHFKFAAYLLDKFVVQISLSIIKDKFDDVINIIVVNDQYRLFKKIIKYRITSTKIHNKKYNTTFNIFSLMCRYIITLLEIDEDPQKYINFILKTIFNTKESIDYILTLNNDNIIKYCIENHNENISKEKMIELTSKFGRIDLLKKIFNGSF